MLAATDPAAQPAAEPTVVGLVEQSDLGRLERVVDPHLGEGPVLWIYAIVNSSQFYAGTMTRSNGMPGISRARTGVCPMNGCAKLDLQST